VISGEDEARFSFIGTRLERPTEDGLVVDIGGGSAEITLSKMNQIIEAISIPIGSLNQIPKAKAPRAQSHSHVQSEHKRVKDLVQKTLKEYPMLQRKTSSDNGWSRWQHTSCWQIESRIIYLSLEERTIQVDHIKEMNTLLINDEAAGLETLLKVALTSPNPTLCNDHFAGDCQALPL
jgi:exopolyphosphatase/guanosine-5'-triphosphate,3'-diphosphate pyrophosphatase